MPELENTNVTADEREDQDSSDVRYMQLGNTTFKVIHNYVGTKSLLDVVKSAIKRDIESGNY